MAEQSIKRLRYFTGQFLEAGDFQAEQKYHIDMRRRLGRALYTASGIIDDGLKVEAKPNDPAAIIVSPGMAIDGDGRALIITEPVTQELPAGETGDFYVTLQYVEKETDQQIADNDDVSDNTRYAEYPEIKPVRLGDHIDHSVVIIIAKITRDGKGNLVGAPDLSVRQHAVAQFVGCLGIGTRLPRAKLEVCGGAIMPSAGKSYSDVNTGILFPSDPSGGSGDTAWLRYYPQSGEAMTLELGISNDPNDHIALMPSGNVGIGTTVPNAKLDVAGDTVLAGNVGIGTSRPPRTYRLTVSGGDTRIAAENHEQSLFGLDKLVGLNDLRFYVDDKGNDEVVHFGSDGLSIDPTDTNVGTLKSRALRFGRDSGEGIASKRDLGGNQNGLDLYTGWAPRLSITNSGKVGIGTPPDPDCCLAVGGRLSVAGVIESGKELAPVILEDEIFQPPVSPDDSKLLLYKSDDSDWAGIGVRLGGDIWFRTGQDGSNVVQFTRHGRIMLSGGAYCDGHQWHASSSIVHKTDVVELSNELSKNILSQLHPAKFRYKDSGARFEMGFVAEQSPEEVTTPDHSSVSIMGIVAVLTRVVQEQAIELSKLRECVAKLVAQSHQ